MRGEATGEGSERMAEHRAGITDGSAEPTISVVIPVWNGADQIGTCLAALDRQTLSRDAFEIIVVDNGSTDETVDVIAAWPGVALLKEARPGSYAARNTGIAAAKGRYIALTDADCIPEPQWLEAALEAARTTPDFGLIGGDVSLFRVSDADSRTCESYERIFTLNQKDYLSNGVCVTANWLSPRQVILETGGFNSELKSGGDFDMARRIGARGLAVIYAPGMVVQHPVRGRVSEILKKKARVTGGHWTREKAEVSVLRMAGKTVWEGAYQSKQALKAQQLSLRMRFQVILLILAMTGTALIELARLAAGGSPKRA